MRIITAYNFKGGTGKTTSNVEIAMLLAMSNKKVAFVDLDPQGNGSFNLGNEITDNHMKAYIEGKIPLSEVKQKLNNYLDLYPTNPKSKLDEVSDTVLAQKPFFFERNLLKDLKNENYDFVIIDLSPKLDRMNRMILGIIHEVLITMEAEICSYQGLITLEEELKALAKDISIYENIDCNKIIITKANNSFKTHKQMISDIKEENANYNIFTVPQCSIIQDLRKLKKTSLESSKASKITEVYLNITNTLIGA